jgi:hypothetical protein
MIFFSILNFLDRIYKALFGIKVKGEEATYTYIKTSLSVWDTNETHLLSSQKKQAEEALQENG